MNHVQAVTVLEATHPENIGDNKNSVTIKRLVFKDSNNNVQQVTKESLNATTPAPTVDEPEEYTLLGIVKFKSPIKWLNTISIVLIHLIFVYGFLTYPLKAKILTTVWGELIVNAFTYLILIVETSFARQKFIGMEDRTIVKKFHFYDDKTVCCFFATICTFQKITIKDSRYQ